ncbi:MAG: 2-hydroxyacid dehydrogenase [Bacteriovorax sp.]|jgi:D-lactate dehydrogenase
MNIAFFSSRPYDEEYFRNANKNYSYGLKFFDAKLTEETAGLAKNCDAVCLFVNDHADEKTLKCLSEIGIRVILLRCAGYNNVDLSTAKKLNIKVFRVPAYSPHAVAEHAVALILTLNRKTHRAHMRVREGNFSLHGLIGFDLFEKTVGVVGTGKIGEIFAKIMLGFGCKVIATDVTPSPVLISLGVKYVAKDVLFSSSDIISLHLPLTKDSNHYINEETIKRLKPNVMLVNTGRGALMDTKAVLHALKNKRIGSLALDVYEEEENYFFDDHSDEAINDDVLARLMTFPNVLITAHQAFLTTEALEKIALTTLNNLADYENKKSTVNEVN